MKKSILMLSATAVCAAAFGFGACSCNKGGDGRDSVSFLNEMLDANYSQIILTVTDTFDKDTSLESEYIINYSENEITVEYTVEEFSSLSLGDSSTDFKTVKSGTATIKDGKVAFVGDDVGISADFANPKFNFKEEYFENVDLKDISFKADVKNPTAFLGLSVNYSDMKVSAIFVNIFTSLRISYTENGRQVEYNYEFSR